MAVPVVAVESDAGLFPTDGIDFMADINEFGPAA